MLIISRQDNSMIFIRFTLNDTSQIINNLPFGQYFISCAFDSHDFCSREVSMKMIWQENTASVYRTKILLVRDIIEKLLY